MKRIVYSLPLCPRCETLKQKLGNMGLEYEERSMDSAESKVDIIIALGAVPMSAPVLRVGDKFFTVDELFDGDIFNGVDLDG